MLHLLGYDHTDEGAEKRRMRLHEDAVMARLETV
jgi:ssRNA-specific RNase YbeY (16S rRNA maturation enzyme)